MYLWINEWRLDYISGTAVSTLGDNGMEYIEMDGSKYISHRWLVITGQDETDDNDKDFDGFKVAYFDGEGPDDYQDNERRVEEKRRKQEDEERYEKRKK